ncbi:MAG: signal peptidase I [Bifidobacteriaceae bacterium]|nr:signal peptidase I [Bifidobacteriaceae bacterium]
MPENQTPENLGHNERQSDGSFLGSDSPENTQRRQRSTRTTETDLQFSRGTNPANPRATTPQAGQIPRDTNPTNSQAPQQAPRGTNPQAGQPTPRATTPRTVAPTNPPTNPIKTRPLAVADQSGKPAKLDPTKKQPKNPLHSVKKPNFYYEPTNKGYRFYDELEYPKNYEPHHRSNFVTLETIGLPEDFSRANLRKLDQERNFYISLLISMVSFMFIIFLAVIARIYVFQPFQVPSGSMENTFQVGDKIFATQLTPKFNNLERGQVLVFRDPDWWLPTSGFVPDDVNAVSVFLAKIHFIPSLKDEFLTKRLIGLPGDHISCTGNGEPIIVNGVSIKEPYIKSGVNPSEIKFDVVVPQNYIFVMGDNRSNSADSRYHTDDKNGGFVPIDNVYAVAVVVYYPFDNFRIQPDYSSVFAGIPDMQIKTPNVFKFRWPWQVISDLHNAKLNETNEPTPGIKNPDSDDSQDSAVSDTDPFSYKTPESTDNSDSEEGYDSEGNPLPPKPKMCSEDDVATDKSCE